MKKKPIYQRVHKAGILDIVAGAADIVLALATLLYLISGNWIPDGGNGDVGTAVGAGVALFIIVLAFGAYSLAELVVGIVYLVSGRRFLRRSFGESARPFSVGKSIGLPYFLTAPLVALCAGAFHWLLLLGFAVTIVFTAVTIFWDKAALWELSFYKFNL